MGCKFKVGDWVKCIDPFLIRALNGKGPFRVVSVDEHNPYNIPPILGFILPHYCGDSDHPIANGRANWGASCFVLAKHIKNLPEDDI